jgi:DNA-binding PadR family transcriptional regulator
MLLGLINQRPLNPYEIIKQLQIMNVHRWYNIANSTVYATLKALEKKEYIYGSIEKDGNMPDKTIYSLTDKGKQEFVATLQQSILSFDYDTNIFSIAAFFIDALDDPQSLLSQRLKILNSCYEMTFFNRKSQRTFTCQIVQNTKRHLKRAKTMQISGIGHSVIRGLVTTGQWFSASTTVYPRGSPQGRRHSYFVDC